MGQLQTRVFLVQSQSLARCTREQTSERCSVVRVRTMHFSVMLETSHTVLCRQTSVCRLRARKWLPVPTPCMPILLLIGAGLGGWTQAPEYKSPRGPVHNANKTNNSHLVFSFTRSAFLREAHRGKSDGSKERSI